MKTMSAEIFNTTKVLFTMAVSRMPTESRTLNPITKKAATKSYWECRISQLDGSHHAP